jgi:hypothetical protein
MAAIAGLLRRCVDRYENGLNDETALFYAERLYAESPSEETVRILEHTVALSVYQ